MEGSTSLGCTKCIVILAFQNFVWLESCFSWFYKIFRWNRNLRGTPRTLFGAGAEVPIIKSWPAYKLLIGDVIARAKNLYECVGKILIPILISLYPFLYWSRCRWSRFHSSGLDYNIPFSLFVTSNSLHWRVSIDHQIIHQKHPSLIELANSDEKYHSIARWNILPNV